MNTCFIAAPDGIDLRILRAALRSRGVDAPVPEYLVGAAGLAAESLRQIRAADLVLGVITSSPRSRWVLFQLGQAAALGKRIVLFVSP